MSADTNLFAAFRRLTAGAPLQVGDVVAGTAPSWVVELPGGGQLVARGDAAIGQRVFVRGGLIEGEAPSLPLVLVEV